MQTKDGKDRWFKIIKNILLVRDTDMKKKALHIDIGRGPGTQRYISQEEVERTKELIVKTILEG
jgi:hypothetical protein